MMTIDPQTQKHILAIELAWGLIANAGGGNWETQTPEWQAAATRWRDDHFGPITPVLAEQARANDASESPAPPATAAEIPLTFAALRAANVARLPEFKNGCGGPAHSQPDGSDWSLGEWSNAVLGELGEAANLIKKVHRGDLTLDEARPALAKEFADVVTYLDLLAFRAGVDLGATTAAKWDEVSARVGVSLRIADFQPIASVQTSHEFFRAFTAKPCNLCGGKRNWRQDGQLQAVCYWCGHPGPRASHAEPGLREAYLAGARSTCSELSKRGRCEDCERAADEYVAALALHDIAADHAAIGRALCEAVAASPIGSVRIDRWPDRYAVEIRDLGEEELALARELASRLTRTLRLETGRG